MSQKNPAGNGDGNLTLYSQPNFGGDSKTFTDSDISLKLSWGTKAIKSNMKVPDLGLLTILLNMNSPWGELRPQG
jgi:hypothetical protein